jgi:hypothetical protein
MQHATNFKTSYLDLKSRKKEESKKFGSKLNWQISTRMAEEIATYSVCGLKAIVIGLPHANVWSVYKENNCITKGFEDKFYIALFKAECELRRIITERIAVLRNEEKSDGPYNESNASCISI